MWQIINGCIGNIMMMVGVLFLGKISLNESIKISKKKLCVLMFLFILIHTIIFLKFTGTIKTLIMAILHIIFYKKVFKIKTQKAILLTFIYMVLLIIIDLLQLLFITEILGISKEYCYNVYANSLLSNFLIYGFFVIIVYLIRIPLKALVNKKLENDKKIIILSILTIICVLMFFYIIVKEIRFDNNIELYLISITILLFVLFSFIKQTMDNYKIKREYDELLKFMTTYENEIEKQRVLRHEIKNEFRTIRAKICDKQKNKEIIEYIDEIVNDKYEVKQEEYAKFGYLPPNGIKGLCYFKMQEAENKGINVSVNISKKVKNSIIYKLDTKQQRDFGRILGVFLDNAIEASIASKEKKFGIEAYVNLEKEFEMIITNTYDNEIDKSKIGKENYSTKGQNRGHGLLLAKQLINKNNIFEQKTDIQANLYIQKIKIKEKI